MSSEWATFYLLVFWVFAYAITLPWMLTAYGRLENKNVGRLLAGVQIGLLVILTGTAIHSYARHERISRIESEQKAQKARLEATQARIGALKVKRDALQAKMKALNVEIKAAKGSDDQGLLILHARQEELQREQKTLTQETSDVSHEVQAIQKTNEDIQKEINTNK
jgi:hypothetical protein